MTGLQTDAGVNGLPNTSPSDHVLCGSHPLTALCHGQLLLALFVEPLTRRVDPIPDLFSPGSFPPRCAHPLCIFAESSFFLLELLQLVNAL